MRLKTELKKGQDYVLCPKRCVNVRINEKCNGKCIHFGGIFSSTMSCRYPERESAGTLHLYKNNKRRSD